ARPVRLDGQLHPAGAGGGGRGGEGQRRGRPGQAAAAVAGDHVDRVAGAGREVADRERGARRLPQLLGDRAVLAVDLVLGDRPVAGGGARPGEGGGGVRHGGGGGLAGSVRPGPRAVGAQDDRGERERRQHLARRAARRRGGDLGGAVGVAEHGGRAGRGGVARVVQGGGVRVARGVDQHDRQAAVRAPGGVRGDRG